MTPEFIEIVKKDFDFDKSELDWDSYLAGYWAAVKRFGERRTRKEDRREIKSKLGYSRIGLKNG